MEGPACASLQPNSVVTLVECFGGPLIGMACQHGLLHVMLMSSHSRNVFYSDWCAQVSWCASRGTHRLGACSSPDFPPATSCSGSDTMAARLMLPGAIRGPPESASLWILGDPSSSGCGPAAGSVR